MEPILPAVSLLVGVLAGGGFVYWLTRGVEARALLAEDRLYAAWKEGADIPPRPVESEEVDTSPLPGQLQVIVDDWDAPETRAVLEHAIRRQLADGFKPPAVMQQYLQGKLEVRPPGLD